MICELCNRDRDELEFHHLIPRTNHSNNWFKKNFTRQEMKTRGINICHECHVEIHKFYPAKTLGREFNTKEKILADEKLYRAIQYISRQK